MTWTAFRASVRALLWLSACQVSKKPDGSTYIVIANGGESPANVLADTSVKKRLPAVIVIAIAAVLGQGRSPVGADDGPTPALLARRPKSPSNWAQSRAMTATCQR
jgi:hypothetical protein